MLLPIFDDVDVAMKKLGWSKVRMALDVAGRSNMVISPDGFSVRLAETRLDDSCIE